MRLLARRMPLFFAALVLTVALATGGTALAGSAGDASTPAADAAAKKKGKKKGCKKAKKKGAKGKSKGKRSASDAAKKRGKKGKKKGCKKGKKKGAKGKGKGKDERQRPGDLKRDKRLNPDAYDAQCKQAEAERDKAVAEHNAQVAAANEDGTVDDAEKAELQRTFAAMQDSFADVRKYC